MTEFPIDRRSLLRTAGTGLVGEAALSARGTAVEDAGSPELELTAESSPDVVAPGGQNVSFKFNLTNTGNASSNPEIRLLTQQSDINIKPSSPWEIIEFDADSGKWTFQTDFDANVYWGFPNGGLAPSETVSPTLTFNTPENAHSGEYAIVAEARNIYEDEGYEESAITNIAIEEAGEPEFEITAQTETGAVVPGETVQLFPAISNTGESAGEPAVYFQAATESTPHNADYYGSEFNVVNHSDNGGDWQYEGWIWGAVSPGEGPTPSVELEVAETVEPGEYTFLIEVLSEGSTDDTATATVTVAQNNTPPSATFIISPENPTVGDTLTFDASASNDPDGTIETYEWKVGADDDFTFEGPQLTTDAAEKGSLTVTLRVTDDNGATDTVLQTIIIEENTPPNANFTISPENPTVGDTLIFDASESNDPDGTIQSYEWDFDGLGDNESTATGILVERTAVEPNVFDFQLQVIDNNGMSGTAMKTITVDAPDRFDPKFHGFGFVNWGGDGEFLFDPPHQHQTIAEEAFQTQFDQEWLPELESAVPVPIPKNVGIVLASALYETLRNGPKKLHSGGHCFGMCVLAREYFEGKIPEQLPSDIVTASDISQPTGQYADVGAQIDSRHRTQALDNDIMKRAGNVSPNSGSAEEPIDAQAEVDGIRSAVEEHGTALVCIGSSPTNQDTPDDFLHQLIGYDVEIEGGSLDTADTAVITVYDPNLSAQSYDDEYKKLRIDVSGPTVHPIQDNEDYTNSTRTDRLRLIGPRRTDFMGALKFSVRMALDFLSNYVEGFISIVANSPVRIDAVAPDGTQLPHPEGPVDGVPPSEMVYLTDATPGDYEIQVEGTDNGEYGLEIRGGTPDGGRIDSSVTGEISAGETQSITATVPEDSSEEGTASAPSGSDPDESNADDEASGDDDESGDGDDGFGPGFGIGSALAGLGGGGYLLKRRLETDEDSEK